MRLALELVVGSILVFLVATQAVGWLVGAVLAEVLR